MPNRDWRTKAELEAILLERIRGVEGCAGATAVAVEEVHDPRASATWTIGSVAGTDAAMAYDDVLSRNLPVWQSQYGLLLSAP